MYYYKLLYCSLIIYDVCGEKIHNKTHDCYIADCVRSVLWLLLKLNIDLIIIGIERR